MASQGSSKSQFQVGSQHSGETVKFCDTKCQTHADEPCRFLCKNCKELVCLKCVTTKHNGHNFMDDKQYQIKRKEIRDKKSRIENSLINLTKIKEEIRMVKASELSKYKKSQADILAQKEAVEKLVQDLHIELDDKWKLVEKNLEGKQNEVQKMERDLQRQITIMNKLITNKDVVKFYEETDNVEISLNDDRSHIETNLKYSSVPTFIPGKVMKDNIGKLNVDTKLKTDIKVLGGSTFYQQPNREK